MSTHARFRPYIMSILVAGLGPSALAAGSASAPDSPPSVDSVVSHISDGRLDMAETQLRGLRDSGRANPAQADRLSRLIESRAREAFRLVDLSAEKLKRHQIGQALDTLDVAASLDDRVVTMPQAQALSELRERLHQVHAAIDQCALQKDSTCLQAALARARAIDPLDSLAAMRELQAHGWYFPSDGTGGVAPLIDAPTSSR